MLGIGRPAVVSSGSDATPTAIAVKTRCLPGRCAAEPLDQIPEERFQAGVRRRLHQAPDRAYTPGT
ncbi:MAG: hypothetical protein MZV70_08615 [Desulfobacterales bacterium]|nr:hypothetical protein [Desulfobacterales bacterium]